MAGERRRFGRAILSGHTKPDLQKQALACKTWYGIAVLALPKVANESPGAQGEPRHRYVRGTVIGQSNETRNTVSDV